MYIDFKRYERKSLIESQKEFLRCLISFSRLVQEQTQQKYKLITGKDSPGIFASIIIAETIIRSDWGVHKIAKKENNLYLLEKDFYFKGKGTEFEGKVYKNYDNWLDFFVDLGDYFIFSKLYNNVLEAKNLDAQLDKLLLISGYNKELCVKIEEIISELGLYEYDIY
jgi:flagellum-specific peptidoglycan hydrolase FlgJ